MLTDIDITYKRESPEWAMGYSKQVRGSVGGQIVAESFAHSASVGNEYTLNKVIGCRGKLKKSGVKENNCDDCPYKSCIAKDREVITRRT